LRLLILGASGGCGTFAVRAALARGHDVRALVREETPYEPPVGADVRRGSVLDPGIVEKAASGRDAVISCLGPMRINPLNPWSALAPPPGFAERSARSICDALDSVGVRRLAVMSAAGVGDSVEALPLVMRWLLEHSTLGAMYEDLVAMERHLAGRDIDWLAVRPVTLVNRNSARPVRAVDRYRAISVVGRAAVARFMLDAMEQPPPFRSRTPMIGWW
jgi:uncharacterized protein YbjT (DUF2867 family)